MILQPPFKIAKFFVYYYYMFDIIILAVGKIKETYWREAIAQYLKRLRPYVKVSIQELPAESFIRDSDKAKAKEKESRRILSFLDQQAESKIFILTEEGNNFDSLKFSEDLKKLSGQRIIFVIGGALGLSEEVKRCGSKLSLSKMTFPHELARVILLEQLYRAITIVKHKNYHY